jgi:arylsulfatase A-like enzyme
MYYFTALAIGARNAHFWPIAFGSSIQIFATVVSPFTIAGEGIREAAQLVVLGAWIGPAAAIVSAALGFWAAEAPTLLGGLFWWLRGRAYQPAYCRVDGVQVGYEEATRAALELGAPLERGEGRRREEPAPLAQRLRTGASLGLGAGLLSGLAIGVVEAAVIVADGVGAEAQVLGYGPLAYAVVLGVSGAGLGSLLSLLPLENRELRGWTPSLAMLALALPLALAITLFRVRRDWFHEQMPSWPVLGLILAAAAAVAVGLFVFGPRLFTTRFGRLFRALPALALVALVTTAGGVAARLLGPSAPSRAAAAAIPETLADRPNLLLIMVDTLRADALACYGGPVAAPAMCSLAQQQGSAFEGFSHASWTKPATATLLTSLLPSSHGATSKTAVLPSEVELVSEVLKKQGYVTGGIVSNINLAESFGFDQGYHEYHYLGPDYLMGAEESSSKLILYQIVRKLWFTLHPGHRVSDFYQDAATVNQVAFDWLEHHRETRFFLFLHYMDPHDPYFAHPYDGTAVARVESPDPDPERAQAIRRLYEGEIEWLDGHVAELLERLRELDLYDDTLIVLTSDHGEEFHEHGGWWHGTTLYEEQIYVPLLVKWARSAGAPSGRVRNRLARLIDVAPTLIAQAGAPAPDPMQGIDLSLDPHERTARDHLLFAEEDHEGNVLRALRTSDWKLIQANPGNPRGLAPVELFAIADDPGENRDLLGRHPEVVQQLLEQVETERRFAERLAVDSQETAPLSREECEKLRVLGYVSDCEHLN